MNKKLKDYLLNNHYNDFALIFEDVTGNIKIKTSTFKESLKPAYNWILKQNHPTPFKAFIVLVNNSNLK